MLAFVMPGLLLMVLALSLNATVKGPRRSPVGPAMLASGGLAYLLAGLYAPDMRILGSFATLAHVFLIQAASIAIAASMVPMGARLREDPDWSLLGLATPFFVIFLLVEIGWQVVWRIWGAVEPGWGQRIGFFGWFAWAAIAGLRQVQLGRAASR